MITFSMDESGYTGYDLLHKEQKFQGASSILINHDDASRLIKEYFPKLQADELKYSSLKRRDSNRKPLFELQKHLLSNYPCITCVGDKRFLLILMFIDYAVEPFYYDFGINLYEDGGNFSMASMVYYVGPAYYGSAFDDVLLQFQNAMKEKTLDSVSLLISKIRRLDWQRLKEFFGPLAFNPPDCIDAIMTDGISTDASFTILNALISRTEMMSSGEYAIEHDRSKNLLTYNERLNFLINCDKEGEFKHSEIATISFPLNLKKVYQIDSKESPSVQLCDVLIGACIESVYQLMDSKVLNQNSVLSLYQDSQLIHFIPDIDFEGQKKFRKGSQSEEYLTFIQNEIYSSKL
ncbi:DUF3800 domain-containing protein [Escherichia coli]